MNEHKAFPLFTAFGDINEKYVSDALDETPRQKKWYLSSAFLGVSAACFCLITVATAAMIALGGSEYLSAFFSGNSNTSSHSDHSDYSDSSYDTLIFNDTCYTRYTYITDTSSISADKWGIAETTENSELKESFEVYTLKGFSFILCIAVKFDDNTYCCYTSGNSYSLTILMNSIQNTDAIKLNSVSTAFSNVKRDGSYSKLLYKGMTSEMLKDWLSNKEDLIDDRETYFESPVLLSFDLSIPALDENFSSVTVTISVNGVVYFILGGQPTFEYYIGEDITKELYNYITTQLDAYICEYTADNLDQPVISPLPDDRVFLFTGHITESITDEKTQLLTVTVCADNLVGKYETMTMTVKNNLDVDSLGVGERVRLYRIKSSDNSKPTGYSMDIIS